VSPKAESFFTWFGKLASTLTLPLMVYALTLLIDLKERVAIIETRSEITKEDHDKLVKLEVRVKTLEKE